MDFFPKRPNFCAGLGPENTAFKSWQHCMVWYGSVKCQRECIPYRRLDTKANASSHVKNPTLSFL